MFKKIKEFIKAFKDTYYTININKFNARNTIEDYRKEVERFSNVAKTMANLYDDLRDAYIYFPTNERQDFVQKIMDLLVYGRRDSNGGLIDIYGWRELYYNEAARWRDNLVRLENLYNEGKYDEVMTKAKEYSNRLEEFYILYGIKENTSENNK